MSPYRKALDHLLFGRTKLQDAQENIPIGQLIEQDIAQVFLIGHLWTRERNGRKYDDNKEKRIRPYLGETHTHTI